MAQRTAAVGRRIGQRSGQRGGRRGSALRAYFEGSRDVVTSLVLVLPLFVVYQVGVLSMGGVRNGVDFVTDFLMVLVNGSLQNYMLFQVGVLALFCVAIAGMRKRGHFQPRLFPWMLLESAVYALLFGSAIMLLIRGLGLSFLLAAGALAKPSAVGAVVLSVGAGLYEELVFRLILMGGLFSLARRVLALHVWLSAALAVVVSSAVFSFVHHLGPLGEPFTTAAFTYRFFAGVLLATVFQARGFAIAAYTHAFYDMYVMLLKEH